jgi:hypothetical protein
MEILDRSTYVGPSHYAHFPVIRLELDLGPLEAWPTRRLGDGFIASLLEALPGLKEHGCSYGEPGGFVRRMTEGEGTWLGHVLEHVAIELQNIAGVKVTFGKTRETERPGVYDVVFEYEQDDVGIEAADVALDLLHCLLPRELRPASLADKTFDLATRRDDFIRYAQRRALGPSTASIVYAAEKRDIPWLRLNSQSLTIYDRGAHISLLWTHLIPATLEGRATFNVQNAMFAAAMAFSMGVKLEDIRHGLRTFDTTFFQAPGRLNVYDEHPFKVLFDYGHNAHAVTALCDLVNRMDVKGRRICVLSAPGDRRDEDIAAIGAAAAAANFDYYICRRDDSLRGRGNDEVPRLLVSALSDAGIADERITMIVDEVQAIEAALRMGRAGDLLLVFADALARGWKQIVNFRPDESASIVPAPRAARAVPRAAIHEEGPADDARPAKASLSPGGDAPQATWSSPNEALVLLRDERGVILAREAND